MKKAENIIVGISIGDLNGIGSEVVLKTFEDVRMLEFCTPVIFANVKMLSFLKKSFDCGAMLHGIDTLDQLVIGKINVLGLLFLSPYFSIIPFAKSVKYMSTGFR